MHLSNLQGVRKSAGKQTLPETWSSVRGKQKLSETWSSVR